MGHEPVEEEEDWEAAAKKNLIAHTQKSYEKKKGVEGEFVLH